MITQLFLVTIIPMYYVTYTMQSDWPTNILACGIRMEKAVHQTIFPFYGKGNKSSH